MLLDLTCKCGKAFQIETTEYLLSVNKHRKHCSRKCANARVQTEKGNIARSVKLKGSIPANITQSELRKCAICGKGHYRKRWQLQKCCSKICANKLMSQNMIGKTSGEKNGMFGKPPPLKQYQRGVFSSLRFNKIVKYRSSYELKALLKIENDPNVIDYTYEPFSIVYSNTRSTIPDFLIKYVDNTQKLVEVKPLTVLPLWNNQVKIDAIKQYCTLNNLQFEVWTEKELAA